MIAMRGSWIAHCPTANRFLKADTFDRATALSAGVKVALGSDVAGGPHRSVVRVARGMIDAAKTVGKTPPTAAECWWQITGGNVWAMGLGDVGRLAPKCVADTALWKPNIRWRDAAEPLSSLLYGWNDRWLKGVWAGGIRRYPGRDGPRSR